jgi:hypothetical protein
MFIDSEAAKTSQLLSVANASLSAAFLIQKKAECSIKIADKGCCVRRIRGKNLRVVRNGRSGI